MSSKHFAAIISLVIIFIFSEQAFAWNDPPVANLEVEPTICLVDDIVNFDGSGSYDPDGSIVEYAIRFKSGDSYQVFTEEKITHSYSTADTYTATLRVKDNGSPALYDYDDVDIYVYEKSDPIYVDKNVDVDDPDYTGDGDIWANAYQELRDAIADAEEGALFYVAEGIYTPGYEERSDSFELKYFMEIQGGFPTGGGERDPAAHPTILSGDLDDNDEATSDKTDNSYLVVEGTHGIILDGLVIKGGFNDQGAGEGAGLYCNGDAEIINCIFEDNGGANYNYGGAVCNDGDDNTQKFTNCVFTGNEAYIGGAVSNAVHYGTKANTQEFTNCVFTGNTAVGDGGAVISYFQDTTFVNCTFYDNFSGDDAGGVYSDHSTLTVTNCIFWDNTDGDGGTTKEQEQICDDESTINVNYSCIEGFDSLGGTGNFNANPLFADASNNDFHLKSSVGRWNGSTWVTDTETSLCVDTGHPSSTFSNEPNPSGDRINMGFYGNTSEASKSNKEIYVSTSGDDSTGNGTITNPYRTIQKGINMVAAEGKVIVENGIYYTHLSFLSGHKGFTLTTTGYAIIDGSSTGRVFYFSGVSSNITIEGFTIQYGKATTGGGAYIGSSPNVKFDDCSFEFNLAQSTSGTAKGGALYIWSCSPNISNCNFDDNAASGYSNSYGGAIYTYDSEAVINSCTIGTNSAPLTSSPSAEIYTGSGNRPTFSNCGIRGGWLGSYMDWSLLPPINGGGNYSL